MAQITAVSTLQMTKKPRIQFLEWRDNFKHMSSILNSQGFDCDVIPLKTIRGILPVPTTKYINSISSDIMITHNPYHGLLGAAIAKRMGKTKTIGLRLKGNYWEESSDTGVSNSQKAGFALKNIQNKAGLDEADFVIACSNYLKEVSESHIKDKNVYTMYEGVDTERFTPSDSKPEYSTEILCVMNLKVRGKLLYLPRFFDYYKSMQLPYTITFLGDGPYRKRVEKQVREAGLQDKIIFKGHVDNIENYYQSTRLLIHPSSLDTLGMALQEAASSGVPAVSTRVGGLSEVVNDGFNGYTTNDMGVFVERIAQLMHDDEQRKWMGANARNMMVEKFSWERCTEKFVSILNDEGLLS